MKKFALAVLAVSLLLILTGCQQYGAPTNQITGNVVKETTTASGTPEVVKDSTGREQCGTYSESLKKIGECLGDLERGDDGYYYCEGVCGYDYTCFRDKRVVPCPTE